MITKKELEELTEPKADIEKITLISSDGKRLLTRIPKDIVDELKLEKGKRFRWLVNIKSKQINLSVEEEDGFKKKKTNN